MILRLRSFARRIGVFLLLVLLLWGPGLAWYAAQMPDQVDDPDSITDAIVVLTGGSERLRVGLDLLRQGKAPLLFVSGVHPETTLDDLLIDETLSPALRQRVILGYVAVDTVGNAVETAVWMNDRHIHSIRLVTAAYHMPRSLLEFRAALPKAAVVAHPVFPPNVKQQHWWSYPGTAELFASEFTKYLVARLRLMVPDHPPSALMHQGPQ
jgi:uncharacterized SAM-binding protein YcdF (DUF218 family)